MEKIKSKQKSRPAEADNAELPADQEQVAQGNTNSSTFCFCCSAHINICLRDKLYWYNYISADHISETTSFSQSS